MSKLANAQDIARFVTAGHAIFTVSSLKSGARYTFKINEPKDEKSKLFVCLLTGPDNGSDYTYLGTMFNRAAPELTLTKASKLTNDSAPVKALRYLCERVIAHPEAALPPDLEVRHEGRCCKCGRPLTVPESIDRGIGPECAAKMGLG